MSDKWIITLIIAGIVLLGIFGLCMSGNIHFPKAKNDKAFTIVNDENAKEKQSINIKIESEEKGTLKVSIKKEKNEDKNDVEFKLTFDEDGNILNDVENITEDEALKEEVDKVVEKCKNEKLYLFDHVSQSYSSYYSKR